MRDREYTDHLNWVHLTVPIGGSNTYLIPADDVTITPKPISQGSFGETVVEDVNNVPHYRCDGWRLDVKLSYDHVPKAHHETLLDLVRTANANGGTATFAPASSDGSYDASKAIDVTCVFGEDVIPVEFSDRARKRSVTLSFYGRDIKAEPPSWISD